jgi:hypothetical protein
MMPGARYVRWIMLVIVVVVVLGLVASFMRLPG